MRLVNIEKRKWLRAKPRDIRVGALNHLRRLCAVGVDVELEPHWLVCATDARDLLQRQRAERAQHLVEVDSLEKREYAWLLLAVPLSYEPPHACGVVRKRQAAQKCCAKKRRRRFEAP